ncbi:hypothetical protein BTUL_0095g00070 [Botrytis tulipae]|uniref:C2H2-type domain-containing protein n=1 Tax=Botrytis tulipae TaxID=87230 RepID=A0A4Z1ELG1_9HELO|nr:hypothetical protein BTUL_0095g00070 [Botrytis tulipae]
MNDVFSDPSMEPHILSQLQYHITLRDFGEKVQKAANAAYPNDQKSGDSKEDLKIVYYGGDGMLAQNRQPCWVSRSDSRDPSFSMVKWGGIQNSLEEAQSDVLLLLDCCSSGTANTREGYGTTELIATCGFNDVANGVGRHSFTYALITELRPLSAYPKFTAAVLIQLSVNPRPKLESMSFGSPSQSLGSPSPASFESNERTDSGQDSGSSPISSLHSADENFPRILLSVRLEEDLAPELSADLFAEWLRMMPVIANSVTVEAGFGSFSTLILVSMPTPIWVFLGKDPAFNLVGIIKKQPNIKLVSSPSSSTLEVARSGDYQSLKTKQQPPARMKDELPLPAYTRQNFRQVPYSSDHGFDNITPYPSGSLYPYFTAAGDPYTPSQDPPERLLGLGGKTAKYRTKKEFEQTFASEIDERPIEKSNRALTPPAPLTASFVNNIAPAPRFACHFFGCGMSYLRKDNRDYHMRSHRAPLQSTLEPLAIFETKEEFMKHLQIDPETYALMKKETEAIYTWLTSDKAHLKDDKTEPPYDWSDFTDYSKNLAMESIHKGGTHQTAYYWNLARPTTNCTNWIARWFLYRSFLNEEQKKGWSPGQSQPSVYTPGTTQDYGNRASTRGTNPKYHWKAVGDG